MFFKFKSPAYGILGILCILNATSGHFINNPFDKISFNKTNDFIHNIEQKFHDISITNILSSSKCLIPSNANNIVRAALIQQCVSPSLGYGNETRCFDELGCFPMEHPWTSALRPLPQPMKPEQVGTKIFLYTKKNNVQYNVTLWPNISLEGSDFDAERNYTAFLVHGFLNDTTDKWMSDLKDAYLKQRDANVFLVDWGLGSHQMNYLQVASNTRIVGAELTRFGKYLMDRYKLNPTKIHLMGHSLGAQISSYFAKTFPGIYRITAFDPAQPGFEGCSKEVRLDKSDASFVDVLHTSGRPFIPLLGCGFIGPVGHVDIYMNGGMMQPKCTWPSMEIAGLKDISDLAAISMDVMKDWIICSHQKAIWYFLESLDDSCTFWARKIDTIPIHVSNLAIGIFKPFIPPAKKCAPGECIPIGLNIDSYQLHGVFYAETMENSPFCKIDLETNRLMGFLSGIKI